MPPSEFRLLSGTAPPKHVCESALSYRGRPSHVQYKLGMHYRILNISSILQTLTLEKGAHIQALVFPHEHMMHRQGYWIYFYAWLANSCCPKKVRLGY